LGAVLAAIAIGLLVGIATSYLQGRLPGEWNSLTNSGAVWATIGVVTAWLLAVSLPVSVGVGVLVLLGEVAGYYWIACPLRGIATSDSEEVLWTMAALLFGTLAGASGWFIRRGRAAQRRAALAATGGVIAGEGLHALVRISSHAPLAWCELVAGLVLVGISATARAAAPGQRTLAAVCGLVLAALVFLVYGEQLVV
jgi:hypothetical protein